MKPFLTTICALGLVAVAGCHTGEEEEEPKEPEPIRKEVVYCPEDSPFPKLMIPSDVWLTEGYMVMKFKEKDEKVYVPSGIKCYVRIMDRLPAEFERMLDEAEN